MSKHKKPRKPKTTPRPITGGEFTRREIITTAIVSISSAVIGGEIVKYSPDRVQTVKIEQPFPITRSFSDGLKLQDETHVQTLRQTAPVIIRFTFPSGTVTNAAG